jgi:hypothetical protein
MATAGQVQERRLFDRDVLVVWSALLESLRLTPGLTLESHDTSRKTAQFRTGFSTSWWGQRFVATVLPDARGSVLTISSVARVYSLTPPSNSRTMAIIDDVLAGVSQRVER